jgi:glycosyltransferase involved in cell wall biosynthesis
MQKRNKIKVIFVVKALGSGGIENYLLRFIRYSNDFIEPYVLCKGGMESHLDEVYKKSGTSIIYLKIGYFPTVSWFRYVKLLRRSKFDAIVDFTGDFASLTLIGAYFASIKKRIVFYRSSRYSFTINVAKLAYAKISNLLVSIFATRVLSNSVAALDYFHPEWNNSSGKYEVIYNGVPSDPYFKEIDKENVRKNYTIPNNAFVVGHVGRFVHVKNHNLILEVATELCRKYENIYFLLCGKGVEEGLGHKVRDLKLDGKIIMPGVVDNIPDTLQAMDVFFFPSIVEGQPNALIEAMLSNLPIVASDISPIQECVPEFSMKSLISLNSGSSVFSKHIEDIYHNGSPETQGNMRLWARKMFSSDKNFNKFLKQLW